MSNKKKLSILAGIFIIVGVIGSLLTVRSHGTSPISEEKTVASKYVSNIQAATDNARVHIKPAADDQIRVTLDGKSSSNIKRELTTDVKDSTLLITFKEQQLSWFNFHFVDLFFDITIYLPEKQYHSIAVTSDNGYISAEQLNTDKIQAEADNGRIELKQVMAKEVAVQSDNGRISLDHVEGKIKGRTNNGRLSLITEKLDRNIQLESDNGKIQIETEKEPTNVRFDVSTDNGSIDILHKYQGSTVIGKGENLIRLKTNNGRIEIK
ncbi:DUF4097 family beta strand repeat-containing protein [Bacillus massiliglaciei]|uniref:DUF4097 family beta strand repeat-containing protein n=1 Tax=Bacillus massiliglaciei TaxID=1816693 RepID=UPI000AA804D7|nr:DUF4097 family beta strand repeat-containing protein [Bacillus massiliglaciei]